jgi:hypothetical protein
MQSAAMRRSGGISPADDVQVQAADTTDKNATETRR